MRTATSEVLPEEPDGAVPGDWMADPDSTAPRDSGSAQARCSLCGSRDVRELYYPKRSPGPVVECGVCGMIFVSRVERDEAIIEHGPELGDRDPRLLTSTNIEDLSECWEADLLPSKEAQLPAFVIDSHEALDRIANYVPEPGRILDFGCGWGFFLEVARERGWEPFGLEPLVGCALHGRARLGLPVIADTLRVDTYPPESFDAITAFQVFEHLPDPHQVLTVLSKTLRPGSVLLIEVPNIDTWSVRLLKKRHRHFVEDHLHFYSADTLGTLLGLHGLEVVEDYRPRRHLTLEHLINFWGARYLPARIQVMLTHIPKRVQGWVFGISVGDIVGVIGRKPVHELADPHFLS